MAKALVLNINGEDKKFYKAGSFTGKQARKGTRLSMRMSALSTNPEGLNIEQAEKFEETLDQIEKMVVEDLYDNQFTVDELQDGIDGDKYFETLITEVSGANEDTGKKK
ncbi:hypothetical protein AABD41_15120 [Staphylococcus pseudoxylosus]|uniref:Phage protein n=1 Tax=Staphylococcus casei TaxID=201828 RepID=A0ABZ2WBM7_9STAP|nr:MULTISPECIES: hypothetical protein [Staphylococcus]MBU0437039.1 hypothetical protein [Staphylococcus succinus]MDW4379957.1 hypothetical protein [Staphylococcus saprophyticus]MDW4420913.1 hypothetical protein [Staphylococcus saprophyticus]MRN64546.1 hypothetical protein [Staphylococcus saprophyticus]PTI27821.1 hypothetical protein BU115_03485 [Staphylococcus xylosus]